jgi:transcriptional regulator of acetoin/glycerol metabolism
MKIVDPEPLPVRVSMTIRQAEKVLISATLEHTSWKISQAASVLGIDRSTLYDKIRRYEIEREQA